MSFQTSESSVKKPKFRPSGLFGLVFALVTTLPAIGVSWLVIYAAKHEHQELFQHLVTDNSRNLANRLKSNFQYLVRYMYEVAGNQMKGAGISVNAQAPGLIQVKADSDILDVSIWKRGPTESVFQTEPAPVREKLGVNLNMKGVTPSVLTQVVARVLEIGPGEVPIIQSAFHGHTVILLRSSVLTHDSEMLIASPFESDSVVAAHVRVDRFLLAIQSSTLNTWPGFESVSMGLSDGFGNTLPRGFLSVERSAGGEDAEFTKIFSPISMGTSEKNKKGMGVMAAYPVGDDRAGLNSIVQQMILVWIGLFFVLFAFGELLFQRRFRYGVFLSTDLPYLDEHSNFSEEQDRPGMAEGQTLENATEPLSVGDRPGLVLSEENENKGVQKPVQSPATPRWMVNNGSHLIGPLTAKEIAIRLFAQELDFDSLCHAEGEASERSVRDAGIFSGSGDADAKIWIYQDEMIHGPMSLGFLRTAVGHGAMNPEKMMICELSTVSGWKKLEEWNPEFFKEEKDQNPLRTSLAPPSYRAKREGS